MAIPRPRRLEDVESYKIYSVTTAVELYGATRCQVHRWIEDGTLKRLPGTGRAIRISGSELKRFAKEVLGTST